jgi:hypothetical protein
VGTTDRFSQVSAAGSYASIGCAHLLFSYSNSSPRKPSTAA